MRVGLKTDDEFMRTLSGELHSMREAYMHIMERCTQMSQVSVMLGDGTVKEEETFDPGRVQDAMSALVSSLKDWSVREISTTRNEDKRRLFTKFSADAGSCVVSVHLSLQYHVLLYYSTDQKVLDYQKRLSEIMEQTAKSDVQRTESGNRIVRERLESAGLSGADEQKIFEMLYNDDSLRDSIKDDIDNATDPHDAALTDEKLALYKKLDMLLLEVYKTSRVLIDEVRLVGGEEGCVFEIDLDLKGGTFDPTKVPQDALLSRFKELSEAIARVPKS